MEEKLQAMKLRKHAKEREHAGDLNSGITGTNTAQASDKARHLMTKECRNAKEDAGEHLRQLTKVEGTKSSMRGIDWVC